LVTASSNDGSSSVETALLPEGRRSVPRLIEASGGTAGWLAALICAAVYLALIVPLTSFPMQDYANHVARAHIMADLFFHHGADFGRFFEVHLAPVPYVLPDLLLMVAVEAFGPSIGAGLFTSLVILSLPCALLFYAHVVNLPWRARPFVLLVGLYLSTDWFFLVGFLAFRLAMALIVVNLAIAELLRRNWSVPAYIAYIAVLLLGFLTHLSAPVFVAAAIGASALVRLWFRTTTLKREIALGAPIALLFAWYFAALARPHEAVNAWEYDSARPTLRQLAGMKIRNLPAEFFSFDWHLATLPLLLFAACLVLPVRRELNSSALRRPAVVEQLVLAAAFLGVYFVLPTDYVNSSYVDIRALPMVTLLLLCACMRLPAEGSAGRTLGNLGVLGLAALLAITNLVYVARPLVSNNTWINRYRAVAASIPKGSYVLPVHTETRQPHLLHVASHIVLDRGAVIPYLFSLESGAPMTYFRYKNPRYAPDHQWYRAQSSAAPAPDSEVNWNRIDCDYDFLMVTMPFDPRRIGVPTVTVASNEAATLLAIDKRPCKSGSP
jgi:hypothetical protein